jgi:hypothetical protein
MKPIRDNYHSYLLRMWRVQAAEGVAWRATLEDVQSGELHGFADLAALLGYLQALGSPDHQAEMVLKKQPE